MTVREAEPLFREIERLIDDYAGLLPASAVIDCVSDCREELVSAGVRAGLPAAVGALASVRLHDELYGASRVA